MPVSIQILNICAKIVRGYYRLVKQAEGNGLTMKKCGKRITLSIDRESIFKIRLRKLQQSNLVLNKNSV